MSSCGCPKGKVKRCVKPARGSPYASGAPSTRCLYGFNKKTRRCKRRSEKSAAWLAKHSPTPGSGVRP